MGLFNLTFSDRISPLSQVLLSHIREVCCICFLIDSKTASTIAASIAHSKRDYTVTLITTIFLSLK